MEGVAVEVICHRFSGEGWSTAAVHVPQERDITIYVNLKELVTILCTPTKLNFLIVGFLYSEGIIRGMNDVMMMRVCDEESEVDVRLSSEEFELPTKRRLTSGCGGGAAFRTEGRPVSSDLSVTPQEVQSLMHRLQEQMELYRFSGGVHASALADRDGLLVIAEDIGRHNTLDKILGECLVRGLPTEDRLLLSTGRISSEMLLKAARMGVPIIVSRHSPTGSAVSLAHDLGISLIGRVRGNRLSVYSHPERLGGPTGREG
jgi:FdhD protein